MSSDPVAITGMHRTGTSMVTRALHDAGLHLLGDTGDRLIEAADDNPEGFWEHKAIVACNDDLLEATGGAWDNPPAFPPQGVDDPRVAHLADAATAALAGLRVHDRWGFKDPRTCLTASYWLDLEPDLRFVICVRHPLEVALSLKRRNQNSYSLGLALWERYYATILELAPPDRRVVTHYDTWFTDPVGETGRLCEFAGLEAVPPVVRDDLRHHTVGVALAEADVSPSVRTLYAALCREAGVHLAPEPAADEGRVRRLVLDGAVAARHAEQRQAAIERLQEREVEHRAQAARQLRELEDRHRARERALDDRHRARERALEAREAEARQQARDVAALRRELADLRAAATRAEARLGRIGRQVDIAVQGGPLERVARRTASKLLGRGRQYVQGSRGRVVPTARQAAQRLPPPAQEVLRRGREVVADPRRNALPAARGAARRLPPPAQDALRRGGAAVQARSEAVKPAVATYARRVPAPVRELLRRAVTKATGSSALPSAAPRATPATNAPRGPALRHWKEGYEELVATAVPVGARWLVVQPASPREVRLPGSTPFPVASGGKPLADDLGHVAHLEALRFQGHQLLVVPEGSRPWFDQQVLLRDHVASQFRVAADADPGGIAFDLTAPTEAGERSLRGEIDAVTAELGAPPAVLDWTDLGVGAHLPGIAAFRPPAGERLPYFDATIDVVVVPEGADGDGRRAEASRVAAARVVTVAPAGSGAVAVRDVDRRSGGARPATPSVLVLAGAAGDRRWQAMLAERAGRAGAAVRAAAIEASTVAAALGDADVVIAVEADVLLLPGSIEAAASAVAADPGTAVAGKVLRGDGTLEAAGGIVFGDRSVALVAAGTADVRAPWHEYVRPVCWAPGLVAASRAMWSSVPAPEFVTGRAFLREWCSAAWAAGGGVRYRPEVAAVRLAGDGGEPSTPLVDSSWQRVLDLRPARPPRLDEGTWRYLLATDDVEGCRS